MLFFSINPASCELGVVLCQISLIDECSKLLARSSIAQNFTFFMLSFFCYAKKTQTCMHLSIAKLTKRHLTFHAIVISQNITTISLFILGLWIFFQNIDDLWILDIVFLSLAERSIAVTKQLLVKFVTAWSAKQCFATYGEGLFLFDDLLMTVWIVV